MNQNNLKFYKNDFVTSFYEIDLDFNNQNIIKYIENYSFEKRDIKTTFFDNNKILDDERLTDLKELINYHCAVFAEKVLLKNNFNIKESWFQYYDNNNYHPTHIHGVEEQNYSLIFYVQCSESSSNTVFFNPGYPYVPEQKIIIKPKQSKLIFFPGYIPHCVEPNKDNERLILSANVDFYDSL